MKYIRTKNKIVENTLVREPVMIDNESYHCGDYIMPIYSDDIVKQTDTIEELCDEFVVENPEKDIHERCCDLQDVFDWVDDQEISIGVKAFDEKRDLISGEHDWNVYGAIWTDKGLIYVAKMNNKGELELL